MIRVEIPGTGPVNIQNVMFDYNGTIAADGRLLDGVGPAMNRLAHRLDFHVVTADTFGVITSYSIHYTKLYEPPICSLLKSAPWIYQGSFSKILMPGIRVGYLIAHPSLMPHLVRLKQAADLHTNLV